MRWGDEEPIEMAMPTADVALPDEAEVVGTGMSTPGRAAGRRRAAGSATDNTPKTKVARSSAATSDHGTAKSGIAVCMRIHEVG